MQVPADLEGLKERFEISELQNSPHAALSADVVNNTIAAYREERVWRAGSGDREHQQLHGLTARQIRWLCDKYDRYAPRCRSNGCLGLRQVSQVIGLPQLMFSECMIVEPVAAGARRISANCSSLRQRQRQIGDPGKAMTVMSSDEHTDTASCSSVCGGSLRGISSSLCMPEAAAYGHPPVDITRMQFSGQARMHCSWVSTKWLWKLSVSQISCLGIY